MKREANILCWETPRSMKCSKRGRLLAKKTTKETNSTSYSTLHGSVSVCMKLLSGNSWQTVTDKTLPRHNVADR